MSVSSRVQDVAYVTLLNRFCQSAVSLFVCAVVVVSQSALAVDVGSELLKRETEIPMPQIRDLPAVQASEPWAPSQTEPTVVLCRDVKYSGDVEFVPDEVIARVRGAMVGQDLAVVDITSGARLTESLLAAEGFLFAEVVVPPQDVTEGVITLDVQIPTFATEPFVIRSFNNEREGTVREPGRLSRLKEALGRHLKSGQPLRRQAIEDALLFLNELPGLSVASEFIPGDLPGTSQLAIDVQSISSREGLIARNNHGSVTTGKFLGELSGSWSNQFGHYERIDLRLDRSEGTLLRSLQANYPVLTESLILDASLSRLDYEGGRADLGNQIDGNAKTAGIGLRYPLVRSLEQTQTLRAGLTSQWSEDYSNSVLKTRFRSAAMSLAWEFANYDRLLAGGATQASLSHTYGEVYLTDDGFDSLTIDQTPGVGLFTDGEFHKIVTQVSRNQRLGNGFRATWELSGQYAFNNLHSSQRRSVGGVNGVRAYPIGEGSSDTNTLMRTELIYQGNDPQFPDSQFELAVFHDHASVWLHHAPTIDGRSMIGPNHYDLLGWGIRAGFETGSGGRASIIWAKKLGHGENPNPGADSQGNDSDGFADRERLFFSLEQVF